MCVPLHVMKPCNNIIPAGRSTMLPAHVLRVRSATFTLPKLILQACQGHATERQAASGSFMIPHEPPLGERSHLKVPLMPARSAGPPEGTSSTRTPSIPICRTVCGGAMVMPRIGRTTFPYFSTCSTSPLAVSMGMAKPTPDEAPFPAHRE